MIIKKKAYVKVVTLWRGLINKCHFHSLVDSVDKQMTSPGQTNFCACGSGKREHLVYTCTVGCWVIIFPQCSLNRKCTDLLSQCLETHEYEAELLSAWLVITQAAL